MRRRDLFKVAAAIPGVAAAARIDVSSIKTRAAKKVEIVYKSPHPGPNGLQTTKEGLWILDHGAEGWVSLVNPSDGKVIREFMVAGLDAPSGITVDPDNNIWINSSHNCMTITCSSQDGKVTAKRWTHGAQRPLRMKGDPPSARTPLEPAYPRPQTAAAPAGGQGRGGRRAPAPYGQLPSDATTGVTGMDGAQGMEFRDGFLYYASLPARVVYVVDPKTWEVQTTWAVAGNRAHGVGWDGDTLWVADTNWRAFFRHDMKSGQIVEKIQLTEKDPLIHGVTIRDGYMWYTDDVGYICNFKL